MLYGILQIDSGVVIVIVNLDFSYKGVGIVLAVLPPLRL